MKRVVPFLMALLGPLLMTACDREQSTGEITSAREEAAAAAVADATAAGTVTETMNTGGYTYVQVDTGGEKIWAAAPECTVNVGDDVVIPQGMAMQNYHSKTLDRDFELVYFVGSIQDAAGNALPAAKATPSGHPSMAGHGLSGHKSPPADIDISGVQKAEGGRTIGEIYEKRAELSGEEVTLRGKVVKYNPQIMGKNWLHVRDGSGDADAGTNDLTVTTDVAVQVGDTVLITGKVLLDKDFGYGYKYDVLIEDAQVVVE